MRLQVWLSIFIFLETLLVIAYGKVKMAAASLLGATLMLLLRLINGEAAVASIGHNIIGLLIGMMIVVNLLSKTGIFQFLAVKAIKVTKGRLVMIFRIISILSAFLSAFFDNVTTVLLITPVVLPLCEPHSHGSEATVFDGSLCL